MLAVAYNDILVESLFQAEALATQRAVFSHAAQCHRGSAPNNCWAEAHEKIARMTLTIKLDRNWSSFQLANSAPPLSVTDSAIAPSARMKHLAVALESDNARHFSPCLQYIISLRVSAKEIWTRVGDKCSSCVESMEKLRLVSSSRR